MINRSFYFVLLFLLSSQANSVQAQIQITKVALLSRIGDSFTVEVYKPRTGTTIDTNSSETIKVAEPTFDHIALLAAQDAILKFCPSCQTATLAVPSAGSENDPVLLLKPGALEQPNSLLLALKREKYSHLLVISKYRGVARLKMRDYLTGSGNISGLGFYIDNYLRTDDGRSGEVANGFIAPYAYLKLTLVGVDSLNIISEQTITESTTRSASGNATGLDPWGALTGKQKYSILEGLISTGITEAVPSLIGVKR